MSHCVHHIVTQLALAVNAMTRTAEYPVRREIVQGANYTPTK